MNIRRREKKDMLDIQKLIASIDAITVAEGIGMDIKRKGKYNFILCPGHSERLGHPDTNASNCVLTAKGYHCFGCNTTKDMFAMVMEYLGVDFPHALNIVAELAGGEEHFSTEENSSFIAKLPLTTEQLNAIFIKSASNYVFTNKTTEIEHGNISVTYQLVGDEILVADKNIQCWSLIELFKNKRKLYDRYIFKKASDAIKRYDYYIEHYCSRDGDGVKTVYNLFNEDGAIPSDVFVGLKNALLKRRAEAQKIRDEYKDKVSK